MTKTYSLPRFLLNTENRSQHIISSGVGPFPLVGGSHVLIALNFRFSVFLFFPMFMLLKFHLAYGQYLSFPFTGNIPSARLEHSRGLFLLLLFTLLAEFLKSKQGCRDMITSTVNTCWATTVRAFYVAIW